MAGKNKLTRTIGGYKVTLKIQHEMLYYEVNYDIIMCAAFYMPRSFGKKEVDDVRAGINWRLGKRSKLFAPMTPFQKDIQHRLVETMIDMTYLFMRQNEKHIPRKPSDEALKRLKADMSRHIVLDPELTVAYNEQEINPFWTGKAL